MTTKEMKRYRQRIEAMAIVLSLALLCMFSSWSQAQKSQNKHKTQQQQNRDPFARPRPTRPVKPEIPGANRYQHDKVFLEYADELYADENFGSDRQVVKGNVKFRKQGMFMYCDSAYFYPETNSLDAFGNVRMEQGDTIFVYADVMYYDGFMQQARLRYRGHKHVNLQHTSHKANNKKTLTTDSLNYDLAIEQATFWDGGEMLNRNLRTGAQDTLTSERGTYDLRTKDVEVTGNVWLRNKNSDLKTSRLTYNTDTQTATIVEPTEIHSGRDNIITSSGTYNTATGNAEMNNRSTVIHRDEKGNATTLEGDSMVYNKLTRTSYVYQYHNSISGRLSAPMVITDTANRTILTGGYGYYNDSTQEAFATQYPLLIEFSRPDTIFLRADSIRTVLDIKLLTDTLPDSIKKTEFELQYDTTRIAMAYRRARFFRTDIQGIADSISFVERDSLLHLYYSPIVWSGKRQVTGGLINVHFNDSTADWAEMPQFGLVAEHVEDNFYNQLSARTLKALIENKNLRHLDGDGNVRTILLPMEKDSTYNKLVNAESSMLSIDMNDSTMEHLKMWPEVTGLVTPVYLAKQNQYHLPEFKWYEELRPQKSGDLGDISDALEQYFINSSAGNQERRRGKNDREQ